MSFIRIVLAVIVGLLLFTLIFVVFPFVGFISVTTSEKAPEVKENSILKLNLNGELTEHMQSDDPFKDAFPAFSENKVELLSLIEAIEKAAEDEKIKGIYLESIFLNGGFASFQEIRNALVKFKESGKFIVAYSEFMDEKAYYLNSVADEIFLNPEGFLEFNGLSTNVMFIKGSLEKLGVEPEIFRVGDFKGAVEPLMRTDLSEENELQINSFLTSIYDYYLENVSVSIGLDISRIRTISDSMKVRIPQDAERLGLITKLSYRDEVISKLKEKLEVDLDKDINYISYNKYLKSIDYNDENYSADRIAVVIAEGSITPGEGNEVETDGIKSGKYEKIFREIRDNDRIKAVVLRINSPGGSLTASDVLWREIMLTKEKVPVIASMSDLAASGGYYLSMVCDTIVALPNTITGSIGIFGVFFNAEELLEDKMGITHDVVKTGEFSDIFNLTRPLTAYERTIIQSVIDEGYETFTTKASEGRNMPLDKLRDIAGGRVWTGEQAKENGLVDVLGGFNDAVDLAADMADLKEYRLKYYPQQKPFIQALITQFEEMSLGYFVQQYEIAKYVERIKFLQSLEGVQALMPYTIEIQ
ncbi:MAG TPA: signal peptide peptidase SppA [Cyclobacteriaceae bacterium]